MSGVPFRGVLGGGVRQHSRRVGLALVCVAALALSGCAATSVRTAAVDTAQTVHLAATSALASYEALRTVAGDSAYNQGYLRVVMSPQPEAVDFTVVADAEMGCLIDIRARACRRIAAAADGLRLACGTRAKAEAVQSYAAAVEAIRGISTDPTATTEFKKLAAALPNNLGALWQTRRLAALHDALDAVATEMAVLWGKELPTWEAYVEDAYITTYAAGLLSLRLASFDEKGLVKAVEAPYDTPVKAGLFKLQKYREAVLASEKMKIKLRQTSEAFESVARVRLIAPSSAGRATTASKE